nr:cation:proton antiporter [Burkholderiaceae bacterium]
LPTSSGQAGFSILLFQDIAAIPILALIPLLGVSQGINQTSSGIDIAYSAIKIVAIIAGIVIGGRLLLRPIFRWIARSKTPEIFTAASLLLVVGIAALMLYVGLSMALGAFLAGVLLAESEYRRELETDIEPFKGLLLGLFFIAVGMSIDFAVLINSPWLMATLLIAFISIKFAVIYGISRLMKVPFQERPVLTMLLAQGGEFAFVVFQAAGHANVFAPQTASLLIGVVALSMLLSPLLLIAIDKLWLPRYADCGVTRPDEISEPQAAPIIIVGFGRYGQIVARLLLAQDIPTTVLDHDADMIETARSFGYRVFYGNATRLDLLRTAGAENAQIMVIAVDDVAQSLAIVDIAQEHFPHLQLVVRAHDATHWNKLRDRDVKYIQRELFESSLQSGSSTLELLGYPSEDANSLVQVFKAHNMALLEQMYPHYKDRAKLISVAKIGREQLAEQMAKERDLRK